MPRSRPASGSSSRYDPKLHGPRRIVGPGFRDQVCAVVRQVPEGRVTTYGDVGAVLGSSRVARQVGYALSAMTPGESDIPWHRVVNARGQVSVRTGGKVSRTQRQKLGREGVRFDRSGRILDFEELRFHFDAPWEEPPRD